VLRHQPSSLSSPFTSDTSSAASDASVTSDSEGDPLAANI
jgi:hypothetical protein